MRYDPLVLAEQTVPRYTSYPTAPHFNESVGAMHYAGWLSGLARDEGISIYLHIPFCKELCLYCGCHTKAARRTDPVIQYVGALRREIGLLGRLLGRRSVTNIHWGGGTPSSAGDDQLLAVVADLARVFDLSDVREHAIELDPRHVSPTLVAALARMGVNKASFGVQDFSPHVQKAIGRIQPFEMVEAAVRRVRDAGITTINFDLMFGLPSQTIGDVRRTAEKAAGLRPSRISLFGYAHVPWFKKQQRLIDEAALPGAAERLAQFRAAQQVFLSSGYERVGLDHFALPEDELVKAANRKRLRRNFQGYTTDDTQALIGIGASAISRLPAGYAQNAVDAGTYSRAVQQDRLAVSRGFALSPADRMRGEMIEKLMCDMELDLNRYRTAADDFEQEKTDLRAYAATGLIRLADDVIRIEECGRDFVRLIASVFDAYRADSPARHSKAV